MTKRKLFWTREIAKRIMMEEESEDECVGDFGSASEGEEDMVR